MRPLVDPLWLLLIVLTVAIFASFKIAKINQYIRLFARISITMLVFLSTGVATLIFDQILATERSSQNNLSPEFIFVLGGGYELGADEAQDFLGTESIRRVNAASALWQEYPQAKIVFSGGQPGTENDRAPTRLGELLSEHAISLRLAESRIIIESGSLNTREHPIEALKLYGVSRESRVAIVTSDFHLRRALGEFKKHFENVESFGTGDPEGGLSWLDFVPLTKHLDENSYRIKEFVGIIVSSF